MNFRFCPQCTTALEAQLHGRQQRAVCPACGYVHYRNPTVGVAVVVLQEKSILLGRRSAASSYGGMWCIPCGHVEWDEEIRAAATREFHEETGLEVRLGEVVAVHSNFHAPRRQTVGVWFRGYPTGGTLRAGDDLDQVAYFPLDAPPELAFPTDQLVLTQLMTAHAANQPVRGTPDGAIEAASRFLAVHSDAQGEGIFGNRTLRRGERIEATACRSSAPVRRAAIRALRGPRRRR